MLELKDLSVAYGQSEVITDLNLQVERKQIVAVMGRNGMGKTTLMKAMIGMIPSRSGTISIDQQNVSDLKSFERVSAGIAFVPQGRMIFSTMTVEENIETGLTSTNETSIPNDLYSLFPVLHEMRKRRGGNLSGGQQQQLAIARALASNPKVLLLDEPTEGIQPSIIKDIARTLKEIRDLKDLTIVVSEQVLSFAMDVADRIIVIEKGKIIRDDPRDSVDEKTVASYLSV